MTLCKLLPEEVTPENPESYKSLTYDEIDEIYSKSCRWLDDPITFAKAVEYTILEQLGLDAAYKD